jgi:hypothetical protein
METERRLEPQQVIFHAGFNEILFISIVLGQRISSATSDINWPLDVGCLARIDDKCLPHCSAYRNAEQ